MSTYSERLLKTVINNSVAKNWDQAVLEWEITDCQGDRRLENSCVCGKEKLYYLFTIQNTKNHNVLYPIGSSCIKKFQREDLSDLATVREKLFLLLDAWKEKTFIKLDSKLFSRKLLKHLFFQGVFVPNEFNKYDESNDYDFLLEMFNKQNKKDITEYQQRKINALIKFSIIPYLEKIVKYK